MVHRWVADGRSPHFTLDESGLAAVAAYVAEVTRAAYPDLTIPYHSRWRHFCGGRHRPLGAARGTRSPPIRIERARTAIDLATVSVLLDAGAGDAWRYREPEHRARARALRGAGGREPRHVRAGAFSADADEPCRVDGDRRCESSTPRTLGAPFPGRRRQSAGRAGAAQRTAAPARPGARRAARPVRPRARASRPSGRPLSCARRRQAHSRAATCSPPCSRACRRSGRRA